LGIKALLTYRTELYGSWVICLFEIFTPQRLAIHLALHQQAADELGRNLLGGAGEKGWGEVLGEGGGYGSGFGDGTEVVVVDLTKLSAK